MSISPNPLSRLFSGLIRGLTGRSPTGPSPGITDATGQPLAPSQPNTATAPIGNPHGLRPPMPDFGNGNLANRGFSVPHPQTFASVWNAITRTYPTWKDEAQRNSLADALAMRRDGLIEDLLSSRKRPTSRLKFEIQSDNPADAEQQRICRELTDIVKATPRFRSLNNWLMEAVHYGRSAVQIEYKYDRVNGKRRLVVGDPEGNTPGWEPVQGDKLVFKWDGTPGVLVHTGWEHTDVSTDQLERTDRGLALFLNEPFYRERFIVHKFEPADADWLFETDQSGIVNGCGLRHRIYWSWFLRQELLSYATNGLQRLSTNGRLIGRYPTGNMQAQTEVLGALASLTSNWYAAFPFDKDNPEAYMLEDFNAASVSYDVLMTWVNYFDDQIRRVYLGQTLSGKSEPLGIGGGGSDEAMEVRDEIVDGDASDLSETHTEEFLKPLIRQNYGELGFKCRFVFLNKERDAIRKAQSAKLLFDMSIPFDTSELRENLGFKPPPAGGAQMGMAAQPQAINGTPQANGSPQAGMPSTTPKMPPMITDRMAAWAADDIEPSALIQYLENPTAFDQMARNPCGDSKGGFEQDNTCAAGGGNGQAQGGNGTATQPPNPRSKLDKSIQRGLEIADEVAERQRAVNAPREAPPIKRAKLAADLRKVMERIGNDPARRPEIAGHFVNYLRHRLDEGELRHLAGKLMPGREVPYGPQAKEQILGMLGKALAGKGRSPVMSDQMAAWSESDHPRDASGQFAALSGHSRAAIVASKERVATAHAAWRGSSYDTSKLVEYNKEFSRHESVEREHWPELAAAKAAYADALSIKFNLEHELKKAVRKGTMSAADAKAKLRDVSIAATAAHREAERVETGRHAGMAPEGIKARLTVRDSEGKTTYAIVPKEGHAEVWMKWKGEWSHRRTEQGDDAFDAAKRWVKDEAKNAKEVDDE